MFFYGTEEEEKKNGLQLLLKQCFRHQCTCAIDVCSVYLLNLQFLSTSRFSG